MIHAATITQTSASLASLTRDYAAYNHWANEQLVNWLKSKPAYLQEQAVASSFSGIKQTLYHILQVQEFWFSSLTGVTPELSYGTVFMGEVEDLYADILEQSGQFVQHLQSMSDEELADNCYVNIPFVGEVNRPVFEIVHHTMTHSAYHRGQLVTIGHHLDWHDAPMTDYMFYLLMAK